MSDAMLFVRPALIAAALALAGCASSTSGFVDEGSDDGTTEQNLIKGLMTSMGAIDPKEKPIEYKPRSPLVVPPKRDLPPPQDPDAVLAQRNFPRNQEDVDRELSRSAAAGDPSASKVWTPDQLARYRMQSAPVERPPQPDDRNVGRPLTPDQLNGQGLRNKEALAASANNGQRRSLVEPPREYRTPSSKAPIEPEEAKSSWKPSWWPL